MPEPLSPSERVRRCQQTLAHAWMIRTFIKHCEESEEAPELMEMARAVFDICRAVEPFVEAPDDYLRTVRKKLSKLKAATVQFTHDAPLVSAHTNFQQAVISMQAVCESLGELASERGS